jgi:sialate O-acetylesterase
MKIKLFFNECVIILLYLTAIVRKIEVGIKKVMVISCCMFLFIGNTFAKITLPSLVGNNMVLQQSTNVKMWGKSTASQVTISPSWTKKKYIAKTDKEGK